MENRKRKFWEISKYNGSKRSSCSRSNNSSRTPQRQSKRMKKHCELDDNKELYEYQRKRDISISKEKQIQSNWFIFQESEGSIQEEAVSTVKKGLKKDELVYKTNEQIFDNLNITKIFSESSCSEWEDVQQSIVTALTDIFWITQEEPDGNSLFRSLSRGWFGSPEFHVEVRENLCDYVLHNSIRFEHHLPTVLSEYISKMLDDGEWGGEPEIVAFSELFCVNIYVYDAMTSPVPYLVAENPAANHSVHLLLTNNNHFDTLKPKNNSNTLSYSKIKKKDYKKKKETQIIKPEKKFEYLGENKTIYAEKH